MDTDIETQRTEDARMLRESLALVAPVAEQLIASFYERLFAEYPQVRSMFPANMDMQREKLLKAVIALVTHYDTPEALLPALSTMGLVGSCSGVGGWMMCRKRTYGPTEIGPTLPRSPPAPSS